METSIIKYDVEIARFLFLNILIWAGDLNFHTKPILSAFIGDLVCVCVRLFSGWVLPLSQIITLDI